MKQILVLNGPFTFSDSAANSYLETSGLRLGKVYTKSNWDLVKNISCGVNKLGIVASYNSLTGLVDETRKGFMDLGIFKVAEVNTKIDQYLCYNCDSLEELKCVYSHPQALNQCSNFLDTLDVQIIHTDSTVEGVKISTNKIGSGAIGSLEAVKNFGLRYMLEPIQNDDSNYTIFSVVIGTNNIGDINIADRNSVLMVINLVDKPNELSSFLHNCHDRNLGELYIQTNRKPRALVEIPFNGEYDYRSLINKIEEWSKMLRGRSFKIKGLYKKSDCS